MAGKPVVFNSGALIKIKVDGVTLAYALSMSYSISKQIIAPPIMGEYGIPSLATVRYNPVNGSLRIIKTAPQQSLDERVNGANATKGASSSDSDAQVASSTPLLNLENGEAPSAVGLTENTINSFDPAKVILSSTFDIEIVRAYPSPDGAVVYNLMTTIKDCRFTTRGANIPLGQLVNETMGYTGILVVNYSPDNATGGNSDKILER